MISTPVAISYSGGTSSEWMVEAVIRGVIPRPEHVAVFCADTGEEHEWTYRHMDEVEARCKAADIEFVRCKRPGDTLGDHILAAVESGATRMDHPPFWVDKGGGSRGKITQRCTREFKTAPIRRAVSAWLKAGGLPKRITSWIGFAHDEVHRATKAVAKNDVQWEAMDFPGIRHGRTRAAQREELIAWTGRAPKFSMCTICPFKSAERWAATEGKGLERAIRVDDGIRNLDQFGITDGPAYLSDRLIPVSRLSREPAPPDTQLSFESCDGGRCFV